MGRDRTQPLLQRLAELCAPPENSTALTQRLYTAKPGGMQTAHMLKDTQTVSTCPHAS